MSALEATCELEEKVVAEADEPLNSSSNASSTGNLAGLVSESADGCAGKAKKRETYWHPSWKKDWNECGVRHFEGLKPGEPQPFLRAAVAIITISLYVGWMNVLLGLFWGSFVSRTCIYILLGLFSTTLLPTGPLLWLPFNRLGIFKLWREYHRMSYLFEEPMEPGKKMIFVEHPHGTFPLGPILSSGLVQTLFPDVKVYSIAADAVFYIPFWRNIITFVGALPASGKNIRLLLKKGVCAIVLGGIAEMYMCHPEKERIKLLGRKGFARIAIEEQIDGVVPVYYFGNSRVLDFGPRRLLEGVSRKWRVALAFYIYGRWCLPVPRPVPLFNVHGRHLEVPKVDLSDKAAVDKAVDELHAAVVTEMQRIYDEYKGMYGWANRPLSIE